MSTHSKPRNLKKSLQFFVLMKLGEALWKLEQKGNSRQSLAYNSPIGSMVSPLLLPQSFFLFFFFFLFSHEHTVSMWRLTVNVGSHPEPLFHLIPWSVASQASLECMMWLILFASLFWGACLCLPKLEFQVVSYTKHLYGFRGPELWSLCFISILTTEPAP